MNDRHFSLAIVIAAAVLGVWAVAARQTFAAGHQAAKPVSYLDQRIPGLMPEQFAAGVVSTEATAGDV